MADMRMHHWPVRRRSISRLAAVLAICLGLMAALPVRADCGSMWAGFSPARLSKAEVGNLQRNLVSLGFDPNGIDGLFGARTRQQLRLFCDSTQFAQSSDLLTTLNTYATVGRIFPNWQQTFRSSEFHLWAENQPDTDRIVHTEFFGDADAVITLLKRYRQRLIYAPNPELENGAMTSYRLSKSDLKQLKLWAKVPSRLKKIAGKSFANKRSFLAAINKVLQGLSGADYYAAVIKASATARNGRLLDKNALDELKVDNTPEYVMQAIQGIQGVAYSGQALNKAVKTMLDGLAGQVALLRLPIMKSGVSADTNAMLTGDSLDKFAESQKGNTLVRPVLKALGPLKGVNFKTKQALSQAVSAALKHVESQIRGYQTVILGKALSVTSYDIGQNGLEKMRPEVFKQLTLWPKVPDRLAKLVGKSFANKSAFVVAVDKVLQGVADPGYYAPAIEACATAQKGRLLTKRALDELKVGNTPEYITQAIQGIQGFDYPGQALNKAVKTALDGVAGQVALFRLSIMKDGVPTDANVTLTDDSLEKFAGSQKGNALVNPVLAALQPLKGVKFATKQALSQAVGNALKRVESRIKGYRSAVLDKAVSATSYEIGQKGLEKMRPAIEGRVLPADDLNGLATLTGTDYPDSNLFWQAVKAKVSLSSAHNPYRTAVFALIDKAQARSIDQPLLSAMKAAKVPQSILEALAGFKGTRFVDSAILKANVSDLFKQLDRQFDRFEPLIVSIARKEHGGETPIQWTGAGCNCLRHNLSGEVYGFYPYWLAGAKAQAIDFSVLNRIGLYSLGFDDKGRVLGASRWSAPSAAFIQEARRYGTRVDLVLSRKSWKSWERLGANAKKFAFKRLAAKLVQLVDTSLTGAMARAEPYIALGATPQPIRGDGITLYFDNYPADPVSMNAFVTFIKELKKRLVATGHSFAINLMFRSAEIGHGIYGYNSLLDVMKRIRSGSKRVNGRLLVLLQEPTTQDKKLLRREIEDGLKGRARKELLRDVVSVLSYVPQNKAQLGDDIIYAGDNFGGIGFWPLPMAATKAEINRALTANYVKATGDASPLPELSKYICPNIWFVRLAWDIAALLLIAAMVTYFRLCMFRNWVDDHFIQFIAGAILPFLVLSLARLFYDPGWEKIAKGNDVLILTFVAIIGYSVWSYRRRKEKSGLP